MLTKKTWTHSHLLGLGFWSWGRPPCYPPPGPNLKGDGADGGKQTDLWNLGDKVSTARGVNRV